jgi:hypothetical protein
VQHIVPSIRFYNIFIAQHSYFALAMMVAAPGLELRDAGQFSTSALSTQRLPCVHTTWLAAILQPDF